MVKIVSSQYSQIAFADVEIFGWGLPIAESNRRMYSSYKIDDFIVVAFVFGRNVFPVNSKSLFARILQDLGNFTFWDERNGGPGVNLKAYWYPCDVYQCGVVIVLAI